MTIRQALERLDGLKHNAVPEAEKIAWLSQLDTLVKRVMDGHVEKNVEFFDYDMDTDRETMLLAPGDAMYLRWLEAQVERCNGEWEEYNAAIRLFNAEWEAFENEYHRTHTPKSRGRFRF